MNVKTNRYRTPAIASALVAALFGIVSCGGDGTTDPPPPPPPPPPAPVAPVAVGSIPAQVMTAGQSVTVDVTPFFSDPDGGTLTYAASSSAEAVLTVSLSGADLTIAAVAAGTATVTVTATDPDGLTATQSAEVTVEAANRAPEAVGTIPAQTMTAGQTVEVDVSAFFSDPDGDDLTYAAESSDTGVISASMSGSGLTVTAVAVGTATVTVTATDPDGLTATQGAEVTVEAAAAAGFRDDFDSAASLDDWNIINADASVADGLLRLTPTTDDQFGIADRRVDLALTDWTIRVRMGRATSEGEVQVFWSTGDEAFPALGFILGPVGEHREHNFRLLFFDAEKDGWFFAPSLDGNSDAVMDEPGEFTDLTIGYDGAQAFMTAGETEILRFTPIETLDPAWQNMTDIWLAGNENGAAVHFDWVHVTGTEIGADMSSRSGAARRLDIGRAALEASAAAKPVRLKR